MADFDHSDYGGAYDAPVRSFLASVLNWIGVALSLALIAGLAYWGYQLIVRDVTGVPVVRALEGPMRIAPEDPGGSTAAYQGLAVNTIAAEGTAAQPPERVVLAPSEPDLTDEDRAMSALLPDAPEAPIAEVAARPLSAIDLAVAAALGEEPAVFLAAAVVEPVAVAEPEIEATAPGLAALDSKGVVAVSPRPEPRPARPQAALRVLDTQVASLDPAVGLPPAGGGVDVDPAAIEPGARLVQLGAYPTVEVAREEWDRVAERFGDFMEGKRRVIEPAEAGGRAFYRLRVSGFDDLADSRRFCAVLVAGEASCIPVAAR
jgi:hypothetical protein